VLLARRPTLVAPFAFAWRVNFARAALCFLVTIGFARFMGHAKVTTTLGVYAHLYADDHSDAMAALGAMEATPSCGGNVVPPWG
jgi:hypothetical protein